MKTAIGQLKSALGDFDGAERCVQVFIEKAAAQKADILILPEGGVFGYPPTDFVQNPRLIERQNQALERLHKSLPSSLSLLVGAFIPAPESSQRGAPPRGDPPQTGLKEGLPLRNGACLLQKGKPPQAFFKERLPDQDVFCESRWFQPGRMQDNFFFLKNQRVQVLVCEDMWRPAPFERPDLLIVINSSPYSAGKNLRRIRRLRLLTDKYKAPAVYVNRAGGQDELLFDGGSFCLNSKGGLSLQCAFFKEDFQTTDSEGEKSVSLKEPPLERQRQEALVMGIRDFCAQTGFQKIHLGLSGGIDSALACFLAVQALGRENVTALFLPGPYTSEKSAALVRRLQKRLRFSLQILSINPLCETALQTIRANENSGGKPAEGRDGLVEQNLQARLRALCLTAFGNKNHDSLLIGTSNKSELTCGYGTLYGDLAGGLMVIGDLFKTEVFRLCRFINENSAKQEAVFPQEMLERPPSAELAPDQKDEDDLPAGYKDLDPVLEELIRSSSAAVVQGEQAETDLRGDATASVAPSGGPAVSSKAGEEEADRLLRKKAARLWLKSEFKRKQSGPVLRLSETAFGSGRRFPVAHKFPL